MKTLQKGFIVPALLVVIALLIVGGSAWFYIDNQDTGYSVIIDTPRTSDVLKVGGSATITWHVYNFKKINPEWAKDVSIRLAIVADDKSIERDIVDEKDLLFTEQGSAQFMVPNNIVPGQYQVRMNLFGTSNSAGNPLWGLVYFTNGTFTVEK